jgi:hypothetical protein
MADPSSVHLCKTLHAMYIPCKEEILDAKTDEVRSQIRSRLKEYSTTTNVQTKINRLFQFSEKEQRILSWSEHHADSLRYLDNATVDKLKEPSYLDDLAKEFKIGETGKKEEGEGEGEGESNESKMYKLLKIKDALVTQPLSDSVTMGQCYIIDHKKELAFPLCEKRGKLDSKNYFGRFFITKAIHKKSSSEENELENINTHRTELCQLIEKKNEKKEKKHKSIKKEKKDKKDKKGKKDRKDRKEVKKAKKESKEKKKKIKSEEPVEEIIIEEKVDDGEKKEEEEEERVIQEEKETGKEEEGEEKGNKEKKEDKAMQVELPVITEKVNKRKREESENEMTIAVADMPCKRPKMEPMTMQQKIDILSSDTGVLRERMDEIARYGQLCDWIKSVRIDM